jgi:hypothetical protein
VNLSWCRSTNEGIVDLHLNVFCRDPRFTVLDDDHRPTDPPAITRNMNRLLVMVDVDPDEFIDLSCPPQLSEFIDETGRIASDADYGAVDMNYEGPWGINFRSCCKRDV